MLTYERLPSNYNQLKHGSHLVDVGCSSLLSRTLLSAQQNAALCSAERCSLLSRTLLSAQQNAPLCSAAQQSHAVVRWRAETLFNIE